MKTQILNLRSLAWMSALVMITTFFSCEKDPLRHCRQDPTCEYFTCKVNGERWEPQCNSDIIFGCTPWDVQYYKNIPALDMYIDNEQRKQRITLLVRDKKLILGENDLYTSSFIETSFSDGNKLANCKIFIIDSLAFQSLQISKIDTINRYLTGTFYFTGKNECGDEVQITDGEFNLHYRF